MSDMNKCQNCGVFVPVEKAFCPNCSEPIEPEEAPSRADSSSSDMMATIRDDPNNYKELLLSLKKMKPVTPPAVTPDPGPPRAPAAVAPDPGPARPPAPAVIPRVPPSMPVTAPPSKSSNRNIILILGSIAFLILVLIILLAFEVI